MLLPIKLEGVTKSYGEKRVLRGVDFELSAPCVLGIVGRNGAGKTVLMRILAGLESPDSGKIVWGQGGGSVPLPRERGMVLQQPIILRRSVMRNVEFALRGIASSKRRKLALDALSLVGLRGEEQTFAPSLSGGQKQCLVLAQILAMSPSLILLDEPSVHMDPPATDFFESIVMNLSREKGVPIILASHDVSQLRRISDKIIFLNEGKVQFYERSDAFFGEIQSQAVGCYLGEGSGGE